MRTASTGIAAALLALGFLFGGFGATAMGAQPGKKSGDKKAAEKGEAKDEGKDKEKEKKPKAKTESYDLEVLGTLGALAKGSADLYEFTYTAPAEGKKKGATKKAWLKLDSGSKIFVDRPVPLTEFKEADSLTIFCKPFDSEQNNRGGPSGGTFRALQDARIILGGKDQTVNEEFADAKDKNFKWCDATVETPGAAMTVPYGGQSYKVTPNKSAAVLRRDEADLKKDVRKGLRIFVLASTIDEKPTGEKESRDSFHAVKAFAFHPSALSAWGGALIPQ